MRIRVALEVGRLIYLPSCISRTPIRAHTVATVLQHHRGGFSVIQHVGAPILPLDASA